MEKDNFRLYGGDGTTISERDLRLPGYKRPKRLDDPALYLASKGLRDAVNVALALGQPLLLTGEPGTGKTELARSVAHELELPLFEFRTKTTSTAVDLFYRYDALRHFHASRFDARQIPAQDFIDFEALGKAILLASSTSESDGLLPRELRGKGPKRSVVLIDEIDKAPRDLPNDVLNEMEDMSFTVRETGRQFSVQSDLRPIVILTSNSEKNLPDAFLRRCAFYHIEFPERMDELRKIVERRLEEGSWFTADRLDAALKLFLEIRKLPLAKKPSTAECLAWLKVLERMKLDVEPLPPGGAEALALSYCVLGKGKEDLGRIRSAMS
jgi:MoxR-like ATPase